MITLRLRRGTLVLTSKPLFRPSVLVLFTMFCWTAASQKSSLVFMQLADPQMGMFSKNNDVQQEVQNLGVAINIAKQLRPAFVVVCGDMINSSQHEEQITAFREGISHLDGIPVYLVPGNHDVGAQPTSEQLKLYRQRFGPDFYTFEAGSFTGIVLNSMLMGDTNAPEESSRQLKWLDTTLSHLQGHKVAIFQHIPFFVHSEDEADSYWNVPSTARAEYLSLLRKYEVKHVFAGHLHYPAHAEANGLSIEIAGATGKPLGNSSSGLQLVEIDGTETWHNKFFPLLAPPQHLHYPW